MAEQRAGVLLRNFLASRLCDPRTFGNVHRLWRLMLSRATHSAHHLGNLTLQSCAVKPVKVVLKLSEPCIFELEPLCSNKTISTQNFKIFMGVVSLGVHLLEIVCVALLDYGETIFEYSSLY